MIDGLEAITFDFGNTLVPFTAVPSMADVVRLTGERAARLTGCSVDAFIEAWGEERLRQFAEDVPAGHEADMDVRAVRVLARLRGISAPPAGVRWDDAAAARCSVPEEVQAVLDAYAEIFVRTTPVPPGIGQMFERLAERYRLGVISNWPLTQSITRFLEVADWSRHMTSVVVSHRVGAIKPWPAIFEVAAAELGVASGPSILHVGDDLGADVAGAQRLGWRTAWIRVQPADSPLPMASPGPDATPDLTLDSVLDLEVALTQFPAGNGR
jgi:FMN phosphatase YigB (HAD superfamily)